MESKEEGKWRPVVYFGMTNLNGRMYDRDSFSTGAIEKMRESIDNKRFGGELGLGHQDERGKNVSHIVDDVEIHSNIMFAKIRTLDTPSGRILKSLQDTIGEGAIVFRPRAIGDVKDGGIVDIHEIISFDAVLSEDDAFKDQQDTYNEMTRNCIPELPELPELPEIDSTFQRKNNGDFEEQ